MSRSAAGGTPPPSSVIGRRPAPEPDRPVQPALLTPGSAVRVPVGYVWVLVTGVVALTIGGYLIGRSRGFEAGRAESARTLAAADQAARETARLREPGATTDPVRPGERPGGTGEPGRWSGTTGTGGVGTDPDGLDRVPAGGRPSDVLAERRTSGKWYFQIITTTYDNAVATAELVSTAGADLGLDAQVVPGDTDQFATVILLPGFDKASMTDEDEDWWRETIRELGSRVVGKVKFSSTTERPFGDAFPRKHL